MDRLSQKVGIPLKVKVISLVSLILGSALIFFTSFSVDLFKKDKAAYIYETSLVTSESIQNRLDQFLTKRIKDFLLISKILETGKSKSISKQIFLEHEDSLYLRSGNFSVSNQTNLNKEEISLDELTSQTTTLLTSTRVGLELHLLTLKDKQVFLLQHLDKKIQYWFLRSPLLSPLEENKIYFSFLYSKVQNQVFPSSGKIDNLSPINSLIEANPVAKSVKEVQLDGSSYLISWSKLRSLDLMVLSLIPEDKAFKAATFLTQKSLYFGLAILGLGLILAVLFSRTLTRPLEVLYKSTQRIASGDFSGKVEVKSSDEIGSLSESFNFMSSEILRYMDEMKEKARLENELAVAKLVQDSFFPAMEHTFEKLSIASFYTPASECGGDWFGIHKTDDKTYILIADATGHGVPAAFLTATISASFNSLMEDENARNQIGFDTGKLLNRINKIICKMQTNLYLTAVALIIDNDSNKMTYTNASHMDPYLIHKKESNYEKSDLVPLLEGKGPRLGHKEDSQFSSALVQLEKEDTLILLTDGILESINSEQKQYGQRKFIKSLCSHLKKHPFEIRDGVVSDLKNFCGDVPFDDDVTLMVMRS